MCREWYTTPSPGQRFRDVLSRNELRDTRLLEKKNTNTEKQQQ